MYYFHFSSTYGTSHSSSSSSYSDTATGSSMPGTSLGYRYHNEYMGWFSNWWRGDHRGQRAAMTPARHYRAESNNSSSVQDRRSSLYRTQNTNLNNFTWRHAHSTWGKARGTDAENIMYRQPPTAYTEYY